MRRLRRIRVLKSFGGRHGVWVGFGWQSKATWPVTRAWLFTVLPPYLRGRGVNFSLYHLSLRIGHYKRIGDFELLGEEEDVEGELAALGWASGNEVIFDESYAPGEFDRDHWAPPIPEVRELSITPDERDQLLAERAKYRQRYVR